MNLAASCTKEVFPMPLGPQMLIKRMKLEFRFSTSSNIYALLPVKLVLILIAFVGLLFFELSMNFFLFSSDKAIP
jgi:hypothetical protein